MLPPGHLAFSYLIAKPLFRKQPTVAEWAALTMGTLFPAVSNVALSHIHLLGIASRWSHSPLQIIPWLIIGAIALKMRFPFNRVPLLFALGIASHLISDIVFAILIVFLSNGVDDVGGSWLYPWRPIIIYYEGPGYDLQPWEFIGEGLFLLGMLVWWKRRDLWFYSMVVIAASLVWLAFFPSTF